MTEQARPQDLRTALKKWLFWAVLLLPAALLCLLVLLMVTAVLVIHVSLDAKAFDRSVAPLRQLARDVHERQRSIWQAQRDCILFDEVLFYKPRPGRCGFKNIEYSTVLTFDSNGYRLTGLPKGSERRPAAGRVVVLGDSQAMGWGVNDGETFASVLAAELGIDVLNLAVSSYGTARELLRLQQEVSLGDGDVVVIQYHPNDLRENLAFLRSGGLPRRVPSDLARLAHTPQEYELLAVTASVAFVLKGRLMSAEPGDSGRNGGEGNHAETFLAVLGHFEQLARARVVTCEVNSYGGDSSFADDLRRLSDDRMIVLKPTWDAGDFYRLDDHLTPQGHRKLAQLIAATITGGDTVPQRP